MAKVFCRVVCEGGFHRYNKGEIVVLDREKAEGFMQRQPRLVEILSKADAKAYEQPPVDKMLTGAMTA